MTKAAPTLICCPLPVCFWGFGIYNKRIMMAADGTRACVNIVKYYSGSKLSLPHLPPVSLADVSTNERLSPASCPMTALSPVSPVSPVPELSTNGSAASEDGSISGQDLTSDKVGTLDTAHRETRRTLPACSHEDFLVFPDCSRRIHES